MGASPTLVRLGRKSEAADGLEEETVDSGFLPFLFVRLKSAAEFNVSLGFAYFFI